MLKRGLIADRKGQNLTIGTLILIILGIVVLVLLIIGFTVGWDFIIDKFRVAPGQTLEAVAQSCKFSANNDFKTDYCGFKEVKIEGKNQFISCEDQRVQNAIGGDINIPTTFCENFDKEQAYCIRNALKEGVLVNNARCDSYGVQYDNQGKPITPPGFGFTCRELGDDVNDNNPQRSTEWKVNADCANKQGDDTKYKPLSSDLVTNAEDKVNKVGQVCCEIITAP